MVHDDNMRSSQAEFYFKDLQDNLIEPMSSETTSAYESGDGNELEEKMRALRSSSAMTYNLLGNGWTTVKRESSIFTPGKYKITYEKQLATLKRNPRKANLDAYLEGSDQLLFCEMKMTEWLFNQPGYLSESYLRKDLYVHPEIYDAATVCLKKILLPDPTDHRTYRSALTQYDAIQMFKHTLAVYNFTIEHKDNIPKDIRLINCVWHLPENAAVSQQVIEMYQEKENLEHEEFALFYEASKLMRECFANMGIDFDIIFVSAEAFAEQFIKTSEQRKYLTRYFG